jgi:pimeloyl-ACP methyl ester carboxylesterase
MKKIYLEKESIQLSAELWGNENPENPLVVCLHGFPDNAGSFRFQVEDFVNSGYRVLCPTLRGYEASSVPENNDMGIESIAADIIGFLDLVGEHKVHLVGHDWGAVIAYYLGAHSAERFKSITTIAIANPARFAEKALTKVPSQLLKSWYMGFNQIPWISDHVARRNDFAYIKYLWRKWSPSFEMRDEHWQNLRSTYSQPGVIKSTLSYYRQNASLLQLMGLKSSPLTTIAKVNVPNLAITGADDGCMDTRIFDHALLEEDYPNGLQLERIANAGHFLHQEKPELLNPIMIEWFNKNNRREPDE